MRNNVTTQYEEAWWNTIDEMSDEFKQMQWELMRRQYKTSKKATIEQRKPKQYRANRYDTLTVAEFDDKVATVPNSLFKAWEMTAADKMGAEVAKKFMRDNFTTTIREFVKNQMIDFYSCIQWSN